MNAEPILRTARLVLRPYREEDAAAIFDLYATDTEVTRYLTWSPHADIDETRAFVRSRMQACKVAGEFTWAITLNEGDDTLVGSIALRINGHKADFGYVLGRPYWGRGFATEALSAVVKVALEVPGVFRVWATCDVENHGSMRVMEKAGLQREGLLRAWALRPAQGHHPRDCWSYSVLKIPRSTVDPGDPTGYLDALAKLCEQLNKLELEGRRVAKFSRQQYLPEDVDDEWIAWLESYRSWLLESYPSILSFEHPLRLSGHPAAVKFLRRMVSSLEELYDELDFGDDVISPEHMGVAVQRAFSTIDEFKTELYGSFCNHG